jgi:hypothetical protein
VPTGLLEHDLARHENAPVEELGQVEVVDLGQIEGLSAAPSTLDPQSDTEETAETAESATIKATE